MFSDLISAIMSLAYNLQIAGLTAPALDFKCVDPVIVLSVNG